MRSKIFQKILDDTPKEVKIFVDKYADLVVRINQILREKGYPQKPLEEISPKAHKFLSKGYDFTLREIAELEAQLGETLFEVVVKKSM